MLGYSKEELKKLRVFDFDINLEEQGTNRLPSETDDRPNLQFETRHRTKGGEIKNVLVVSANIETKEKDTATRPFSILPAKNRPKKNWPRAGE